MASTMSQAPAPEASQGSTMSSSEDQSHLDLESQTTTPSASPQKPRDPIEPGTSNEPEIADVENIADGTESESESVSSDASDRVINFRLQRIARHMFAKNRRLCPPLPIRDDENLEFLMQHMTMMSWLSDLLKGLAKPPPPPEIAERVRGIPEMRLISLDERARPLDISGSHQPRHAIDVLVEEPRPARQEHSYGQQGFKDKNASLVAKTAIRPDGIPSIPAQILIHSLPIKRILSALVDGRLVADDNLPMYFHRPFKLLVFMEDKIRQHAADLRKLCAGSISTAGGESSSLSGNKEASPSIGGDAAEETDIPASKDDVESNVSSTEDPDYSRNQRIFTPRFWSHLTTDEFQEATADFDVLISFMDKYIFPLRKTFQEGDDIRTSFREIWHLFTPGSLVYVKDPGVPQKVWRVVQGVGGVVPRWTPPPPPSAGISLNYLKLGGAMGEEKVHPFTLDCYYIDFNGTQFVRVFQSFTIDEFPELVNVRGLPILPLHVAENEGLVDTNMARERGTEFISYTQPSYCYFRGRSLVYEPDGQVLRRPDKGSIGSVAVLSESIESPVVVDFERCLGILPDWKPCRVARDLTVFSPNSVAPPANIDDDRMWDLRMAEQVLKYTDQTQSIEIYGREPPSGDEVLLLPDRVFAYVLRTRRWACIPIGAGTPGVEGNSLTRMKADHAAWDYLQIDDRHRSIIESMMATHFRKKKSERRQFDLIQDKGKGLIVLLHGVPGVGKTSTAETVAQFYNKPLLPITCGDLGMTPSEVEANLQSSFQLAQAWECVLLLDEADVFLAERSQDNIERNALVSVFLRVMEYYEGILFLTTNKVGSFDEAFKSRMSMALYYPPLTFEQTEKIWEMQMERTERLSSEAAAAAEGGHDESQLVRFNRLEIKALAKELWGLQQSQPQYKPVWNGRQIRNAFQTAVALAEFHQQRNGIPGPVCVKRVDFEKVAVVSNEFNAYLWEVKHRRGDGDLKWKQEHRFDRFDSSQFSPGWGGQGFGQGQHQQSARFGMPSVWDTSQSSNTMGFGGHSGMGMGPNYGGNMQNQTWQQPGFGGMGNSNVGTSGMPSIVMGGSGLGNSGMGMGNQGMGNQGMGNQGMGNSNMGSGMQPGTVNVQVMPGQNMPEQQQQQASSSSQGFGQGNAQPRSSGW